MTGKTPSADLRKTILIAEDKSSTREVLRLYLESSGRFRILLAADGREALEVIQSQRPDLAIIDLQMPRLNGYNLIRLIRSDPALRAMPAIAVTAYAMQGDRDPALLAGFDDFLTKPIDWPVLFASIQRLLAPPSPIA